MQHYRQLRRYPPSKKYIIDKLLRFVGTVAALLFVCYLIYHIGDGFQTKLETAPALSASGTKTLTMEAYLFRDEQVFTVDSGIVRYHYDDYDKVEADGLIATVYSSTSFENKLAISRIDKLNRQIELLTESAARAQLLTNESATNTAISTALSSLRYEVHNGRYSTALTESEEFYLQLSRRELQQSAKPNYNEETKTLTEARDAFVASLEAAGSVTALRAGNRGGYFTRICDGYEGIFDYAGVMSMSLSAFNAMVEQAADISGASANTVGKIVADYRWYAVARADRVAMESFAVGRQYTVSFPDNQNADVSMTLERTVAESGSKDVLLIFSCTDMPTGFSYTRHQNITVHYNTVSGLKVSRAAVREFDGQSVVYIMEGARVKLRAVKILDRVGGYYYIDPKSPAVTLTVNGQAQSIPGLSVNESVIVYGIDLYHGRIFK